MSKFRGMLLFDIADEPIGNWEENLSTRGMLDQWVNHKSNKILQVDPPEEEGESYEVWWYYDDDSGFWEAIGWFETWEEAMREAKEWMKENQ